LRLKTSAPLQSHPGVAQASIWRRENKDKYIDKIEISLNFIGAGGRPPARPGGPS
jgi:hypothetical protein